MRSAACATSAASCSRACPRCASSCGPRTRRRSGSTTGSACVARSPTAAWFSRSAVELARLLRRLAPIVVLACALAPAARAGPGLLVGVDDDGLKWQSSADFLAPVQDLGLGAVRVTFTWRPGRTRPSFSDAGELANVAVASTMTRVVVEVGGGRPSVPPRTRRQRAQYCAYLVQLLRPADARRVAGVRRHGAAAPGEPRRDDLVPRGRLPELGRRPPQRLPRQGERRRPRRSRLPGLAAPGIRPARLLPACGGRVLQ